MGTVELVNKELADDLLAQLPPEPELVVDRSPELARTKNLADQYSPLTLGVLGMAYGVSGTIRITQEIRDRAVRGDGETCPLALAFKAAGWDEAVISGEDPYLEKTLPNGDKLHVALCLGPEVVESVGHFDRTGDTSQFPDYMRFW